MLRHEGVRLHPHGYGQHPPRSLARDLRQWIIDRIDLAEWDNGSSLLHGVSLLREVLAVFATATIRRLLTPPSPISPHSSAQPDLVLIIEGHHTVVEEIGRGERGLAIVELGEGDLGVSVDEGLLVDAPDPLHGADIEGVLGAAVARTLALELAMRLLLTLGLLKRGELALGQHQALLGDLRLERLEPLLHGLKFMALPHAAHAGGRDRVAALADLVGDPDLAEGGLLKRQSKDQRLNLGRRVVG